MTKKKNLFLTKKQKLHSRKQYYKSKKTILQDVKRFYKLGILMGRARERESRAPLKETAPLFHRDCFLMAAEKRKTNISEKKNYEK